MGARPRLVPHDPRTIDRLYSFYAHLHGAEFSSQQLCLRHMAEACSRIAWADRFEKGLCDKLAAANEDSVDHLLDELAHLGRKRTLYLRQFDRAFARFCALRAARNESELHLRLTGSERYPVPARTLVSSLSYSLIPVTPHAPPAGGP